MSIDERLQGAEWVPLVIVANKSDLDQTKPELRQVTAAQGLKLAEEYKCGFTEASARTNQHVAHAFELMVEEVEKSYNPTEPASGGKCRIM